MMDALDGLVPTPILDTKDLSKVKENDEAELGAIKRAYCIDQYCFQDRAMCMRATTEAPFTLKAQCRSGHPAVG